MQGLRGPRTGIVPAVCSMPTTMECARSLWAQAPPALSGTLHNVPSQDFVLQCKGSFIQATKLSKIEQIPFFSSTGWESPALLATICLSSSSSSLHFLLSRVFSPKVTLQQLPRSFPLSSSAGKEIFKNQSAYFLSCVQRFLRAGGKQAA